MPTDEAPANPLFAQWLREARAGSRESLGKALHTCWNELYRFADRIRPPRFDPKESDADLVQMTYLEALMQFHTFRGDDRDELLAWLRTILRNKVRAESHHFEAAKRDATREVPLADRDMVGPGPAPDEACSAADRAATFQQALSHLPYAQRELITWRIVEGWTFAVMSGHLGCTVDAARMRFARALRILTDRLPAAFFNDPKA